MVWPGRSIPDRSFCKGRFLKGGIADLVIAESVRHCKYGLLFDRLNLGLVVSRCR